MVQYRFKETLYNDTIFHGELIRDNNKKYCQNRNDSQAQLMRDFMTFQPTKRRDVLDW